VARADQYPPIGMVRSGLKDLAGAPKQGPEAGLSATIEIDPAWAEGLQGLKPGRWLWVMCSYDRADRAKLKVHPRGDHSRPLTGVFNTRSPHRPNPISLTLVRLEDIQGTRLTVRGLEAVDGTPVLDIKPYVPGVDRPREDRA